MCLGVALTGGLSSRLLPRWRVGDLHQFTGMLSLGLLATHICVLVGLRQQAFSVPELLVPLARQLNPLAPLFGITALYVVLLVSVVSHGRRYVGLRMWRMIHMLSFVGFFLALAHAIVAGPDAPEPWIQALYGVTVAILLALTVARVRRAARPRSAQAASSIEIPSGRSLPRART
jgi:sulfoxide reductase heme-binding subunit YedZ